MTLPTDWRIKDCFTIIFALMLYVIYFRWVFSKLNDDPELYIKLWTLDSSDSYPLFAIPVHDKLIDIR